MDILEPMGFIWGETPVTYQSLNSNPVTQPYGRMHAAHRARDDVESMAWPVRHHKCARRVPGAEIAVESEIPCSVFYVWRSAVDGRVLAERVTACIELNDVQQSLRPFNFARYAPIP